MKDEKTSSPMSLEPERYEFAESAAYHFDFDRRQFLKVFGGGIFIFVKLDDALEAQETGGQPLPGFGDPLPNDLGAWLHVGEDGVTTVYTGKVEVGQNVRTSLAQAVADELRLPMESVQLVMADTDRTPYDIGTFGSFHHTSHGAPPAKGIGYGERNPYRSGRSTMERGSRHARRRRRQGVGSRNQSLH